MTRSHWKTAVPALVLGALASGNLGAQQETFTYDDLGRLVTVEHGDNKATNYSLDPAGNRKNLKTSDGTPPTTPTNVVATPFSATQINLSWTASTDNVGVTEYRIERCEAASCSTFSQIANPAVTTYSDTPLSDATLYRYRIRAGDASGNVSAYSTPIASATTPDGTAPSIPTNVVAITISASQINLTWTASTDNVAVTGYRVERCTGVNCSSFTQVGTPAGPSFNNNSLADATTYRYRVRARDAIPNLSGYSSIVTATTLDGTAPSTPGGFTATAVAFNQVNLAWTASTDNVAVTGYRVERCAGAGCTNYAEIATPATNGYTDLPVSGSSTYRYRVRANDAVPNFSGYSSVKTVTTPAGIPVPPVISPSSMLQKIVGDSYTIAWNAVTGATSYELFDNGGSVWTGTATSKGFSAVLGEHLYTVKACNGSGCSGTSNGRFVQVCLTSCP